MGAPGSTDKNLLSSLNRGGRTASSLSSTNRALVPSSSRNLLDLLAVGIKVLGAYKIAVRRANIDSAAYPLGTPPRVGDWIPQPDHRAYGHHLGC